MIALRTVLNWLEAHQLADDAEVWVLGADAVEPVTSVLQVGAGSMTVESRSVWSEPVPVPLRYRRFFGMLLESYSAAGHLQWTGHPDIYRGSYVVNPNTAVFLTFLPDHIELIETHDEKMEKRRKQAKQLTKEIEDSWGT